MHRVHMIAAVIVAASVTASATAQDQRLAEYFGFDPLEVIRIDDDAGPIHIADINDDGLNDLIVINNYKSRIELHIQKRNASPDDEFEPKTVNDLPEHWRFRRELITVSHRVNAIIAHDFDGDGRTDLIYAGSPPEIVFLRQSEPGVFEVARKHRVRGLPDSRALRNGMTVADIAGDRRPELLVLVGGELHAWTIDDAELGQPDVELRAGKPLDGFFVEDFNGDGVNDVLGVMTEDVTPLRLWLAKREQFETVPANQSVGIESTTGHAVLGAQARFEMPPLVEVDCVRLPGQAAALIGVIERASKRIVFYRCSEEQIENSGDRDASLLVYSFTDAGQRGRDVTVADVNGDGLLDVIATDTESNSVVVYPQVSGDGLQPGRPSPSLSDLKGLAAGNVDDDPGAEVFVLSEKEGIVGRSDVDALGVGFPQPLGLPEGYTPVAFNLVELQTGPHVAVVAKDGRKHAVELIAMDGSRQSIDIGTQSRSPETILALDADQDGRTDLLLFTRDKPMTMLQATDDGFELRESKDMGQFGLVQAARAENTAVFDVDADGLAELLIADKNFVRAVRYDADPGDGRSAGWQVVTQVNAADGASKLVSLTVLGGRIVAADSANRRLVVMAAPSSTPTLWTERESIFVPGFEFDQIFAGSFAGDGQESILAVGEDGFAVIRFGGYRVSLDETASWRTDKEERRQHEFAIGDVNGDGFTDVVTLDNGEQMCEFLTFSEAGRLYYVTGFQVFETKVFSRGQSRINEPSEAHIADLTGDGLDDLLLLSHDRLLLYPQATENDD